MPNYHSKSHAVKQLTNTVQKSRTRTTKQAESGPIRPKFLSPVATKLWKKVTAEYSHLQSADTELLVAYVQSWEMLQLAQDALREHGLIISQPITNKTSGNIVGHRLTKNPAATAAKDAMAAMQSLSTKLGLDPSSRERLGVDLAKKKPTAVTRTEEYVADDEPIFQPTLEEQAESDAWDAMTDEQKDAYIAENS